MKLNNDCIRDLLLTVEENTSYQKGFTLPKEIDKAKRLESYDIKELLYHVEQCSKSSLIETKRYMGEILIVDLTPQGHEFIGSIRQDTIWNTVKENVASAGVSTLPILFQIATKTALEYAKLHLGL